ncbi:uncharacterized protein LOC116193551 [Punica granatum]|uniref:Uncharacterized protein LOC116193551 n=1 Tax=Punica granatum TaxID=22663 RepID=A0A6P8C8Z5_PUNGR|nr:uncharacterized protein LOC116193551 [Punica granatum]
MALSFCCTASVPPLQRVNSKLSGKKCLQEVKSLVKSLGIHSVTSSPVDSLRSGNWVKLICGASFEDVVDIRNLSLVYTLAGVDCIDCAADESVVGAVHEGIEVAREILPVRRPWVMISVNDDEDLHFRKAEFDPEECPTDCLRPCESVCPASAISWHSEKSAVERSNNNVGVITERCYGCGRCFPVCPYDKIRVATYVRDAAATAELIHKNNVEAIEIHTSGRNISQFKSLWEGLEDSVRHLKLVAVSLPDLGDSTLSSMDAMYSIMEPRLQCLNLWQLDGRPMSGDIGRGATRESVAFAVRLAAIRDRPNGFLQLAGGTNAHTVNGLKKHGLFRTRSFAESSNNEEPKYSLLQALIGGVAYGGYARKIVGRILTSVQSQHGLSRIEDYPEHLLEAIVQAIGLVGTVKGYDVILDWK